MEALGYLRAALRLLLTLAVTFLGLLLVTFLIGRVVPIDPGAGGRRATAHRPRSTSGRRQELGLDLPLWQQFFIYLGDVLRGRFRQLGPHLAARCSRISRRFFPATLELATVGTADRACCSACRWASSRAAHQGRWPDQLVRVVGLLGYSVPVFWLGPDGPAPLLRQARLGGGARAGSTSPTTTWSTPSRGVLLVDAADRRRVGGVLATRFATSSCRPRCWAISRSPTSPA